MEKKEKDALRGKTDDCIKIDQSSKDLIKSKLEQIKEILPNCFVDNEFNEDLFKQVLGLDKNNEIEEKYRFQWVGKSRSIAIANTVTNDTLIPVKEKSMNFDESENIIIEGDNLQALKILQKSYYNKVDVIYIDPPYNTGNDFVYNDDFAMNSKEYRMSSGQLDDDGNKNTTNQKSDAKYHTNWLNMMYPRLMLARELLKDDGVIFISIDDNEQARLKMICDEIFGEQNFVSTLIWKARRGGGNDAKHVAVDHEYLLVYAKEKEQCKLVGKQKKEDDFKFKDEFYNERGKYNLQQFDRASLTYTLSLDYPIQAPDGALIYAGHVTKEEWGKRKENKNPRNDWRWMMSQDTFEKAKQNGFIVFEKNKNNIWNVKVKSYQKMSYKNSNETIERFLKLRSILSDDFGITMNGNDDLNKVSLRHNFSYPKPKILIKNILKYFNNNNILILDFFAGSGTTGQAVMDLNKEDGGNRKYILVQLPEKLENNDEFETIADITRERIKRSIEMYEYKEKGFKYFKVDSTNRITLDDIKNSDSNSQIQSKLLGIEQTFKKDRTNEQIIYELMLRIGLNLNTKFNKININNNELFIDESKTYVLAITDKQYNNIQDTIIEIFKSKNKEGSLEVYLNDNNFKNSEDIINTVQQLKNVSENIRVRIL